MKTEGFLMFSGGIEGNIGLKSVKYYRRSRPEVFSKKGVLRNFTKFTRKYLCQSLFFNKVAGLWHRCFPVHFVKFLRTPFHTEHLWWLLLILESSRYSFTELYLKLTNIAFMEIIQRVADPFLQGNH